MNIYIEAIILGLVLSADSFSAALAMGARSHKISDSFRFGLSSGGAEALVTFLGAIAGAQITAKFDHIDHWISFILLIVVGLHMIKEGIDELKGLQKNAEKTFHGLFKILIVSFATSLDALAVGVSLGVSQKPIVPFILSIGLCAFLSTIIGMQVAKKASEKIGAIFNFVGAFVLIFLGIKFLIEGLS